MYLHSSKKKFFQQSNYRYCCSGIQLLILWQLYKGILTRDTLKLIIP